MSSSKVHVSANLLLKHFKSNLTFTWAVHLFTAFKDYHELSTSPSYNLFKQSYMYVMECWLLFHVVPIFFFLRFAVNSNIIQVTFTLELNQFLDIVNIFLISVNLFGHTYRYLLTFFYIYNPVWFDSMYVYFQSSGRRASMKK